MTTCNIKTTVINLICGVLIWAMVSATAQATIVPFVDLFDGPTMTNWSDGVNGQYNGTGQYVMIDDSDDSINRSTQPGSFIVTIELLDIQSLGWFNYRWDDRDGYRIHLILAGGSGGAVAAFNGSNATPWSWVSLAPTYNFGTGIVSIILQIQWIETTSTVSISAAANGGLMTQIASYVSQVPAPNDSTPTEHLYYDGPGSAALDNYSIMPPQIVIEQKCHIYDMNGDCIYNLIDFSLATQCWLVDCSSNPSDSCCDCR